MEQMTPGSMVAVFLPEREVEPYLIEGVSVAVVNGPSLCVVSGEPEAVEKLETNFRDRKSIIRGFVLCTRSIPTWRNLSWTHSGVRSKEWP